MALKLKRSKRRSIYAKVGALRPYTRFVFNGGCRKYILTHPVTNETMRLDEWAKELHMSDRAVTNRVKTYGWSVEDALTVPNMNR